MSGAVDLGGSSPWVRFLRRGLLWKEKFRPFIRFKAKVYLFGAQTEPKRGTFVPAEQKSDSTDTDSTLAAPIDAFLDLTPGARPLLLLTNAASAAGSNARPKYKRAHDKQMEKSRAGIPGCRLSAQSRFTPFSPLHSSFVLGPIWKALKPLPSSASRSSSSASGVTGWRGSGSGRQDVLGRGVPLARGVTNAP